MMCSTPNMSSARGLSSIFVSSEDRAESSGGLPRKGTRGSLPANPAVDLPWDGTNAGTVAVQVGSSCGGGSSVAAFSSSRRQSVPIRACSIPGPGAQHVVPMESFTPAALSALKALVRTMA